MGVGLKPLEFTDCLTDSPYFRENLHYHERELDKTSQQIKRLVKEVKDLLLAAKSKFYQDITFLLSVCKKISMFCNSIYLYSIFDYQFRKCNSLQRRKHLMIFGHFIVCGKNIKKIYHILQKITCVFLRGIKSDSFNTLIKYSIMYLN